MEKLSRRSFLGRVGGGLVAFVPAALVLADVREGKASNLTNSGLVQTTNKPSEPPQVTLFENYAEGVIKKIDPDRVIIKTNHLGDVELRLSPESKIWKGDYKSTIPMEIDDYVDVWGQPYDGGKIIDVEKMWLNIVNLRGPVLNIELLESGIQITLIDGRMGEHFIKFNEQTMMVLPDGKERGFNRDTMRVMKGQIMQVIGLKLKDSTVIATRVWAGDVLRNDD